MSQPVSLEDRVVQLEELFSHQQHFVEQLNQVTQDLRADVETLQAQVGALTKQLKILSQEQSPVDDRPEKPPHY